MWFRKKVFYDTTGASQPILLLWILAFVVSVLWGLCCFCVVRSGLRLCFNVCVARSVLVFRLGSTVIFNIWGLVNVCSKFHAFISICNIVKTQTLTSGQSTSFTRTYFHIMLNLHTSTQFAEFCNIQNHIPVFRSGSMNWLLEWIDKI